MHERTPKTITLAAEEKIFTGTTTKAEAEQIVASVGATGGDLEGREAQIYYPASGDTYADFVDELKGYSQMPNFQHLIFYGYAGTGLVKAHKGKTEVLKIV